MFWDLCAHHPGVSGFYSTIVTLIQLDAFVGLNYSK